MFLKNFLTSNSQTTSLAKITDALIIFYLLLQINKYSATLLYSSSILASCFLLLVITIVPWYMGYLLHIFKDYPKNIRLIFQWVFAFIILALMASLLLFFIPYSDTSKPLTGLETFIFSFGTFFLVLGPLMTLGGYADAESIDNALIPEKPYTLAPVTFTILLITLSIALMLLIIGQFDPTGAGITGFGVVALAFIGGPVVAVIAVIPLVLLGEILEKNDKQKIMPKAMAIIIPVLVVIILLHWQDLLLYILKTKYSFTSNKAILVALFLSGILPFRIILMCKPPFDWRNLVIGIVVLLISTIII